MIPDEILAESRDGLFCRSLQINERCVQAPNAHSRVSLDRNFQASKPERKWMSL